MICLCSALAVRNRSGLVSVEIRFDIKSGDVVSTVASPPYLRELG